MKKNIIRLASIITLFMLLSILISIKKNLTYNSVKDLINKQQWIEAYSKLEEIQDYKDAAEITKNVKYHYYLQLGDTSLKNKNFSLALDKYKLAEETNFNAIEIEQKIKTVNKSLAAKQKKAQTKYKITKYQLFMLGDNWKYVLIPSNIKQTEMLNIAKELHTNYPTSCFKLFSSLSFLKLIYNYDSTKSYITKEYDYNEEDYEKYDRGLINKMAGVWSYTTPKYESVKLE